MRPPTAELILKWLLRLMGFLASLAIVAVFMPTAWIEAGAERSGAGSFVDSPLNQYLVRSVSALYALLGVFVLYLARDVRRYRDLIVFMGWMTIVLGLLLTGIDYSVGMPAGWTWAEGPPTILVGAAFIWLARSVSRTGI